MLNIDPKNVSPAMIAAAARQLAAPAGGISRPMPIDMPMVAPGPPGGYNRYREMTLEELLLE
ncbi:MAG: hypothetical protein NZ561_09935, partial [Phycisphaerae bacterium]|nr:hypothetical protein [Phycisphaerae bacterium]